MTTGYRRELGLFSSTMIVAGSMVGSGIFIVSADIMRQVHTAPMLMLTWLVAGLFTICATLSYGELTGMIPKAGGLYVFLREGYGPLMGFLYGWCCFLVIESGAIAAVGVGAGKYLGALWPSVDDARWIGPHALIPAFHLPFGLVLGPYHFGLTGARLVGIGLIAAIALLNTYGVRLGAWIQNTFTVAKLAALGALILLGLLLAPKAAPAAAAIGPAPSSLTGFLTVLLVAQIGAFFSCDGWNFVGNVASEIKEPKRTLPLALLIGPASVIVLYLLANLAYLRLLGPAGIAGAPEDRVGAAALGALFGPAGSTLMAGAILVSMIGYVNGASFTSARVYQAMGEDGLFGAGADRLNRHGVPAISLWLQAGWACLLTLTGTFEQLVDFTEFAQLLFVVATIAAVILLRRKRPDLERPYKVWGYPVVPLVYILGSGSILVLLLRYKPAFTWPGLILALLGVPVYYWRRGR
ncbi:MAG TPA: amino acid permease [Holophagaceae bacterium]|nr:amino acid permease [Holophagaceae bacterium]